MGSRNALSWSQNVLKCIKCVENRQPSYCYTQYFTITAMDNFDNENKNSLSTLKHTHDTALTVFQVKPKTWQSKPITTLIDIPIDHDPISISKHPEVQKHFQVGNL